MIEKYHNPQYGTLGGSNVPLRTGDRRWSQDRVRDFRYQQDLVGLGISDLIVVPAVFSGGVVTQGGGANLNITAGYGYAKFEVDIPDSFASIPPTVTQEDLEAIRITWGAQTNINASDANCSVYTVVDDGATPNYVKMRYLETDGNTRNRAKYTGSYAYEILPEFDLIVDGNAPTDYDIHLATFTSSGGTYSFTFNATILVEPNIHLSELAVGITSVKGAAGVVHIANGTNADTNWIANAPLVVERNGQCNINIRSTNSTQGQLIFSDPDAVYSGVFGYDHSSNFFDWYTAGSGRMRLNATGLYIGGGANPSNLLHIQGTTTPQFRIAYDGSNYLTINTGSTGNTLFASTGSAGQINFNPGGGYVQFQSGTVWRIFSSDNGEYGQVQHNGSNLVISTGGASAGDVVISNTTESTSKDTGALIVEGGVGVEKTATAGYGFDGVKIKAAIPGNGVISWSNTSTQNDVYDSYAAYFPEQDGEYLVTGGVTISSVVYPGVYAKRTSTALIFYYADGSGGISSITATDGSGTAMGNYGKLGI